MKTLVNKANPQIRITAEVETLYDKSRCVKYYYVKDLRLGLLEENWTLVEEEPTEGIKGNLEEIPSNVDLEKAAEEYALSLSKSSMGGKEYCKQDFIAGAQWMENQFKHCGTFPIEDSRGGYWPTDYYIKKK